MKEICGYRGLNGEFYEKEHDCLKADAEYKVTEVAIKLDNFSKDLQFYVFSKDYLDGYSSEYRRYEENVYKMVARQILLHSDDFIEVIGKKKELEKELDTLKKAAGEYAGEWRLSQKKWWLELKWW